MTQPTASSIAAQADAFGPMLRAWRRRRGASQLALALQSGVSQRHVSFLESGRARPSREMVVQLSSALDVPLRQRNTLLLAAGFTTIATLGTPQDVTLQEVRIECFFPADDRSDALFKSLAAKR